jgi:hypothetical protein
MPLEQAFALLEESCYRVAVSRDSREEVVAHARRIETLLSDERGYGDHEGDNDSSPPAH